MKFWGHDSNLVIWKHIFCFKKVSKDSFGIFEEMQINPEKCDEVRDFKKNNIL